MLFGRKPQPVSPQDALPGRPDRPFRIAPDHVVLGTPLEGPWPDGYEVLTVAMGCFWGVRADLLGAPRRLTHGGRLHGRLHARTRRTRRPAPA